MRVRGTQAAERSASPTLSRPGASQSHGCTFRADHAAVLVPVPDRTSLEPLARNLLRPAVSAGRLAIDDCGRVQLHLRRPFRDGTTHFEL